MVKRLPLRSPKGEWLLVRGCMTRFAVGPACRAGPFTPSSRSASGTWRTCFICEELLRANGVVEPARTRPGPAVDLLFERPAVDLFLHVGQVAAGAQRRDAGRVDHG